MSFIFQVRYKFVNIRPLNTVCMFTNYFKNYKIELRLQRTYLDFATDLIL